MKEFQAGSDLSVSVALKDVAGNYGVLTSRSEGLHTAWLADRAQGSAGKEYGAGPPMNLARCLQERARNSCSVGDSSEAKATICCSTS